jgi:hypothetical protein
LRRYGGTRLGKPRPCPHCESGQHRKNGGSRFQGDVSELFYEDCHYAKPIVDLCLFHAVENPFNASERILQNQYGLQVDRDTIQRYAERFGDEVADRHGVQIAGSTVSMNFLSLLFGASTVDELKTEFADELASEEIDGLVGVADETYPAKKVRNKTSMRKICAEKQEGENPKKWPEGFTSGVPICRSSAVSPDSSVGTQPSRERWRSRSSSHSVAWTTGLLTTTTPITTSCRIK